MWWISGAWAAEPISLADAIRRAADHPAVQAEQSEADRATARARELAWGLAPTAVASAEIVDGTGNVVPGPLFPVPGLPIVAGPVVGVSGEGALQSSVAATARWDVGRIPEAAAALAGARSEVDAEQADVASERLRRGYQAALAYVDAVQAEQEVAVAQADLGAARQTETQATALVNATVRPGVDATRARSETVAAEVRQVQAARDADLARARLAAAIGAPDLDVEVAESELARLGPAPKGTATGTPPEIAAAEARVDAAGDAVRASRSSAWPDVSLLGAGWARGGGWPGPTSPAPDTPNWAVGAIVSWATADVGPAKARIDQARAGATASEDRLAQVTLDRAEAVRRAAVELEAARKVVELVPARVTAARAALEQAEARYAAGLTDLVEVEDARALELSAEGDAVAARAGVARAALAVAYANGTLPTLEEP